MDEKCRNCGRKAMQHIQGKCPQGVMLTVDAGTVERFTVTGHPRLLKAVLSGEGSKVMPDVHITALTVVLP